MFYAAFIYAATVICNPTTTMNKNEFERYLTDATIHIPPARRKAAEARYPHLEAYGTGPRRRGTPWRYGGWLRETHLSVFIELYESREKATP